MVGAGDMNSMHGEDLTRLSVERMATLLRQRNISSVELLDAHAGRIEQENPALNAMVVDLRAPAREDAVSVDRARARGDDLGPLTGIPVTVKECYELSGTPHTFGLSWRRGLLAERDDAYVSQLRRDGAIILGKTNVAQHLLYYESDNPVYGRTGNPWHPDRTCGGSSGGEAAIIAVGGSPLGLGTDIGGSARIPAAFCGIAGFKPTQGRAPDPGRYSVPIGQQAVPSQIGVLARHVGDIALGLRSISAVNAEATPALGNHREVDVSRLRIAYYGDDGTMKPAPAVARAVREAADALSQAGADVFEWKPPGVPEAVHVYFALLSGDAGHGFHRLMQGGEMDPRVKDLARIAGLPGSLRALAGRLLHAVGQHTLGEFLGHFGYVRTGDHWALVEQQSDYRQRFADALDRDRIDVILCPPCALPAYRHGASRDLGLAGGYGLLWNLLGYPAGIVPWTRVGADEESSRPESRDRVEKAARRTELGSAGLPVAVQVAARPWREHQALAVMAVLEEAARKRPDFPSLR